MTEPAPSKCILIVDDDPDIRDVLGEILVDEGYSVAYAENGAQALDLLASTAAADMILLDLNMPIMNGYQFLGWRAIDAGLAKIPVIVMSASAMTVSTFGPDRATDMPTLVKPIDVPFMLAMLRRCSETVTAHRNVASVGSVV